MLSQIAVRENNAPHRVESAVERRDLCRVEELGDDQVALQVEHETLFLAHFKRHLGRQRGARVVAAGGGGGGNHGWEYAKAAPRPAMAEDSSEAGCDTMR
eukprot:SAG31_NODE_5315_length_2613_cov_4.737868_4_plen_100_part_00